MGARNFVDTWIKSILTFFVICASIASVLACIFLIEATVQASQEADAAGHAAGNATRAGGAQYNTWEKITGCLTYSFWILMCLVIGLVEFEPLWVFNYVLYLHYWFGRGLMQMFMGLQLFHASTVMPNTTDVFGMGASEAKVCVKSLGWCYLSTGFIYILLSMMCLRRSTEVVDKVRGGRTKNAAADAEAPISTSNVYMQGQGVPMIPNHPHAQLQVLKQLQAQGVAGLEGALVVVERAAAAEREREAAAAKKKKKGWFGFGKGDKDAKSETAALAKERTGGVYGTQAGSGKGIIDVYATADRADRDRSSQSTPEGDACLDSSGRGGVVDIYATADRKERSGCVSEHASLSQGSMSNEATSVAGSRAHSTGRQSQRSPRSSPRSPVVDGDVARRRQLEDEALERAYYNR